MSFHWRADSVFARDHVLVSEKFNCTNRIVFVSSGHLWPWPVCSLFLSITTWMIYNERTFYFSNKMVNILLLTVCCFISVIIIFLLQFSIRSSFWQWISFRNRWIWRRPVRHENVIDTTRDSEKSLWPKVRRVCFLWELKVRGGDKDLFLFMGAKFMVI